jgi:hypothetical protein
VRKIFSYFLILLLSLGSAFFATGLNLEIWDNHLINESFDIQEEGEFLLEGPDELCLYYGSIIGDFSGGGLPTDVFSWKILREDGSLVVEREGAFQTFSHTFSEVGLYLIELNIRRGTNQVFSSSKNIVINPGVDLVIQNSYLICDGESTELTLIDPNSPDIDNFVIEWKDGNGQGIGNGNTISVSQAGSYSVDFYTTNDDGERICPFSINTNVRLPVDYSLTISSSSSCNRWTPINLSAGTNITGTWFYTKDGSDVKTEIGVGGQLQFNALDLGGPGNYDIIFEVDNSNNRYCKLTETVPFEIFPFGQIELNVLDSESCDLSNGQIEIRAISDLDQVVLFRGGEWFLNLGNFEEGEELTVPNLGSGSYTLRLRKGSCDSWMPFNINLLDIPLDLSINDIQITGENCTEVGKENGAIKIILEENFSGTLEIFNGIGLKLPNDSGIVNVSNEKEITIDLPSGNYYIELENETGCKYSHPDRIWVPTKPQVDYTVPDILNICESFEFIPNTNQNLKFTLTYPNGTTEIRNFDQTFFINQPGEYTIVGTIIDETEGLCPRERKFFVNVTDAISYEPELVDEDCFGNKTYRVRFEDENIDLSQFTIRWFNENNVVVGTGLFLFPTTFGQFKLEVQPVNSEVCPTPPKEFTVERPILQVDINISSTQFCPFDRFSTITVDTDFDEVDSLGWLLYDENAIGSNLLEFSNQSEITVTNEGAYEVVLFNVLGCEIGRKLIEIEVSENLAYFDIPDQLSICQTYDLVPETQLDLIFTITAPNGDSTQLQKGEQFTFDQDGEYVFEAKGADEEAGLCRIIKTIEITLNEPVNFEPELFSEDCEGNLIYRANIFQEDPDQFEYYWFDPNGDLVGEGQFFQPSSFGEFQVEVRPKGSLPCPDPVKSITIVQPVTEVEATLEATPLCPNSEFGVISLVADLEHVKQIDWYFTDINGQRQSLPDFVNETDIAVPQEGTYEVELINHIGCVLGSDLVLLIRSVDEVRPVTEEEYVICPFYEASEGINPGEFAEYAWYLNNELVSTDPILQPIAPGNYTLTVTSIEGCQYSTEFTVRENCKFQVVYPNAVQPSNPEKGFVIYSNYLVDELSVWVYNKWGQLLFYCLDSDIGENKTSCSWDGSFEGKFLLPGSYVLKIQYKNKNENEFRNIVDSIMIID